MKRAIAGTALLLLALYGSPAAAAAAVDGGVIRLSGRAAAEAEPVAAETVRVGASRRAFDYEAFQTQLASLWFQRRALIAGRRTQDAEVHLERIRALCSEHGVQRIEALAGALIAEAARAADEGDHEGAQTALHYAGLFDPDRPQIRLARAEIAWRSGAGIGALVRETAAAVRLAGVRAVRDLSLPYKAALLLVLALGLTACSFAALMLLRHHTALRHEVEEWCAGRSMREWSRVAGWAVLGLPVVLWIGAGWALVYWLALCFRYMSRSERVTTVALLLAAAGAPAAYRAVVGLYGTTADPAVRATLAAAGGEYDPDRVVRLRQLVETHPDDATYHFLLAGLYKSGRYFEEAFQEYRRALEIDPQLIGAQINLGNTFFATGQYGEAIQYYRQAIALQPDSFEGYFNTYLAQSEEFRFAMAEQSLQRAHEIDRERVTRLLAMGGGPRPTAQDATLEMTSVWRAALEGRHPLESADRPGGPLAAVGRAVWNAPSLICLLALTACAVAAILTRHSPPARRCARCGRAFCPRCKSLREARDCCSQCVHLYVLRDGLAPETKARKLYEVERHARRTGRVRRLASVVFPGAGHVLAGRIATGLPLMLLWSVVTVLLWGGRHLVFRPEGLAQLLAASGDVPARFPSQVILPIVVVLAPLAWLAGNIGRRRSWES